jgi:exodeoxyribonuclease V alpha subunit
MKLNMADILAKARLAKEIKEAEEEQSYGISNKAAALGINKPCVRPDVIICDDIEEQRNLSKPLAHVKANNVGISAIAALRERLKLAAAKESVRATEAGHTEGYLPADEMIEVKVEHLVNDRTAVLNAKISSIGATTGMHGESITYNKEQQSFIDLIGTGKPCVLVGAAGTGKTTCSQGGIKALIASGKVPVMQSDGHKHLVDGTIGIIIISYTRRAVNNIRKVQSTDLKSNCLTSHKLLEYAPEYYDITDPTTGLSRKTMQFSPSRNASNPLSETIHTIIVEEASMLSVELFSEISSALMHTPQWVFIGDIQQLPPVFGSAILGFKMLELPVIELIEVYRQALESPIIKLAHRILSGVPILAKEYASWKVKDKLTLHPWKKKLSADNAALTLAAFFKGAIDNGVYDIDNDMILIPYNKACGTIEINNQVANHLARKRNARTFEVMAGFNKHYFSIGDKVLYDREDAEIIDILPNPTYTGNRVQASSRSLDYWGHNSDYDASKFESYGTGIDDVDFMLSQITSTEERVTQASHNIVVRLLDTAQELTVSKASEVNALLLAYALTVHKAQGSEWRKVFFCLHQSHATMMQRELLYTGVTRAREELYVICEPETFTKGILSQKIKGNTLKEKAVFFKGKLTKNQTRIN